MIRTSDDLIEDDGDGSDGPWDPDIVLITDYLARALPPDESIAVERRLVDDEAFFLKVWPLMRAWRLLARDRQAPAVAPRPSRRSTLFKAAAVLVLAAGISAGVYVARRAMRRPGAAPALAGNPLAALARGTRVATVAGETKEIILPGGSRIVLRQDSRMSYRIATTPGGRLAMATLEGEASIELTREDRFLIMNTSAGRVSMLPGSYAVRCEPGCAAMVVAVDAGNAELRGSGQEPALILTEGQAGRIPANGAPELATRDKTWPAPAPASPNR